VTTTVADARRTDTRSRLIDTAVGMFRSQGVSATGLDQVCRAAGVTKGVFAHHFRGGKHELIAAAIELDSGLMLDLLARVHAKHGASVPGLVAGLFSTYGRLFGKYGDAFGCPIAAVAVESGLSPEDAALAGAAFTRWRDALVALDPRISPALAALIIGALEGAILQARAGEGAAAFDQIGTELSQLVAATAERNGT
jgi:AcrR family transcriptional regulator